MNTLPAAIVFALAFLPAMTEQNPPSIPGLPEWVTWLLFAIGAFMARDILPWLRQLVDADFKSRQEREKAENEERRRVFQNREERFLVAYEQATKNSSDLAAALQMLGEARIVNTFELQEMRRDIELIVRAVVPANPGPHRRRITDRREEP